jgi:hypothetical protein
MKTGRQVSVIFTMVLLALSYLGNVRAQASTEALEGFLDTPVLGVRIQVNATAQARPGENITVVLVLTAEPEVTEIKVQYFNLSIIGFLNGTYSTLMKSVYDANFSLDSGSRSYSRNYTFAIPEWVSGKAYGQITLSHWATYQLQTGSVINNTITVYNNASVCGFYMTDVENVYLESLQQNYQQLNQSYTQLQQNYTQLQKNLTDALRGNSNSLDSARTVITVLMITTIFFVATTLYLVIRKPKEPW